MSLTDALRDADGNVTVPAHQLAAAMQLWAEGAITKAQAMQGGRIPGHAEADLDALSQRYGQKAESVAKMAFISRLERCAILYQDGIIDAAQFNAFMELG